MRMADALDVDIVASEFAYVQLHDQWDMKVQALAEELIARRVGLVVADVPYLPLAAAQLAGVVNVGLCSLNWADVMSEYLTQGEHGASVATWIETARRAYASADAFYCPAPSMPMPWLPNRIDVGPIGRVGRRDASGLVAALGLRQNVLIVLVGMGGVGMDMPIEAWPARLQGRPVHYIAPEPLAARRDSVFSVTSISWPYADLVASVDLVLTKPGYGMFLEAAGAGTPVVYVEREGWPDVPSLVDWLLENGVARGLARQGLGDARLAVAMNECLREGRGRPFPLTGADEVVSHLRAMT